MKIIVNFSQEKPLVLLSTFLEKWINPKIIGIGAIRRVEWLKADREKFKSTY